ncbi:hypothetical protein CDAR_212491 [Caerostris darwini]|uniref:Uncharacterized protein n=1 Tax=Caerostris darwini TaxID=1538125 RepID=A0AAV4PHQ0_9ARAC|nr:hypothetical protein CDAR_212491 [Caerostris darwini]
MQKEWIKNPYDCMYHFATGTAHHINLKVYLHDVCMYDVRKYITKSYQTDCIKPSTYKVTVRLFNTDFMDGSKFIRVDVARREGAYFLTWIYADVRVTDLNGVHVIVDRAFTEPYYIAVNQVFQLMPGLHSICCYGIIPWYEIADKGSFIVEVRLTIGTDKTFFEAIHCKEHGKFTIAPREETHCITTESTED